VVLRRSPNIVIMTTVLECVQEVPDVIQDKGEVCIDNLTFQLSYKWTVSLYLTASVLVQASQFFGDPLACEMGDDAVDEEAVANFCLMYSVFLVPSNYLGQCASEAHAGTSLYNSYYQWVAIFFLVSALLFYIPRCIWLSLEGGIMSFLVTGCLERVVDHAAAKHAALLTNFCDFAHNKLSKYALGFFLCELLNIVITVCHILVTHVFLNYKYLDYGPHVYHYYRFRDPITERNLQPDVRGVPECE